MPDAPDARIAVVGAAGFVGRVLLRRLQENGVRVTAIVRGDPELSIDGDFHSALSATEASADGRFDVVINLAYPTSGPGYEHPQLNLEIGRTVSSLVRDGGHLIQTSTLAVFGLALDRTVTVGPVPEMRDDAYVECKIAAEHLFAQEQERRGLSLDIVRLGNIWGYASGSWAVTLTHKLITGRPVGIAGAAAHSNTTDVTNVASYLEFLISQGGANAGVRYHHLAEFSGVQWGDWIEPLADALAVEPVYATRSVLAAPLSGGSEFASAFASLKVRSVYRHLAQERITGSWSRALVRQLPSLARARLKSTGLAFAADPEYTRAERTFLAIMAGEQEFASVVRPEWAPPLAKDQSLAGVLDWLGRG
jgi:nucleoside-diphosphate-sugar epimerase